METYTCDNCGACCKSFPIYASAADAEGEPRICGESLHLPPEQATPAWQFRLYPLPFLETCCFLNEQNRCEIYCTRSEVCRQFTAGSAQCQEVLARQGLLLLKPTLQIERG
jgi:Fe-S-cluster containining protein